MSALGDDLRKYLILPNSPETNSSSYNHSEIHVSRSELEGLKGNSSNSIGDKAEEMEIDYPHQTSTKAIPSGNSTTTNDTAMSNDDGVFKLDDFVTANKAQFDAEKANKLTTTTSSPDITNNEIQSPITPIPVGARSSKHIVLLHQKVQALALPQPIFTFHERGQNRWAADLSFPGRLEDLEELQRLSVDGVFNSKNEAKEAASKRGMEVIEELEKNGRVSKTRKAVNRSVMENEQEGGALNNQVEKKDPPRNWIGLLLGMFKVLFFFPFFYIYVYFLFHFNRKKKRERECITRPF